MSKCITAAALLVWLVGCTWMKMQQTKGDDQNNKVAEADVPGAPPPNGKMVCSDDYPTGSHIPDRKCTYQDQIDQDRLEVQDELHANRNKQMGFGASP
jgi:hypothetical protein